MKKQNAVLTLFFSLAKGFQYYYFALVMATGIVSLGCNAAGYPGVSQLLLAINSGQYLICLILAASKTLRMPGAAWQGLIHPTKGPGYLTAIAATGVLGEQYAVLTDFTLLPVVLLYLASAFYLALIFTMIAGGAMAVKKCGINQGLDGSWLLCTVSGCSVVMLGMTVSGKISLFQEAVCIGLWAASIMLYFIIIPLIFYRWLFTAVNKRDFSPSWWINMGAMAIASLAGVKIINNGGLMLIPVIKPVIVATTWFMWASALWWLLLLGTIVIWRLCSGTLDFRYAPVNWSIVFPCGMMVVTTINVMKLSSISWSPLIINAAIGCVFALWLVTWGGMLAAVRRFLRRQYSRGS